MPNTPEERIAYVLRLGRAFHVAGSAADRVEQVMSSASRRLGLEGQFFSLPTSLMASFGPVERQSTHLLRVQPGAVDLGRMAALEKVARDVDEGRLGPREGSAEVERVLAAPRAWPRPVTLLASGIASGTGCLFLGGGVREVAVAVLVGLVLGLLRMLVSRRRPLEMFEFAGGVVGGALVTLVAVSGHGGTLSTTTLGGLVTLLPGLTLTLAMKELASRHLSSGTARLSGAVVGLIGLVVGAAIGTTLVAALVGMPRPVRVTVLPPWTRPVALGIAPLAFGVLLGARPRDLPAILVGTLIGFLGLQVGEKTLGAEPGAAIGGLAAGLAANVFERLRLGPATVVQVPGVLLLVPGSVGFRSVSALLDENVVAGVNALSGMLLTAVALAAGLLFSNVLLPPQRAERG